MFDRIHQRSHLDLGFSLWEVSLFLIPSTCYKTIQILYFLNQFVSSWFFFYLGYMILFYLHYGIHPTFMADFMSLLSFALSQSLLIFLPAFLLIFTFHHLSELPLQN